MDDREQRIRELAYFIWLEEGRPEGQRSGTGEKRRESSSSRRPNRRTPEARSRRAIMSLPSPR